MVEGSKGSATVVACTIRTDYLIQTAEKNEKFFKKKLFYSIFIFLIRTDYLIQAAAWLRTGFEYPRGRLFQDFFGIISTMDASLRANRPTSYPIFQ